MLKLSTPQQQQPQSEQKISIQLNGKKTNTHTQQTHTTKPTTKIEKRIEQHYEQEEEEQIDVDNAYEEEQEIARGYAKNYLPGPPKGLKKFNQPKSNRKFTSVDVKTGAFSGDYNCEDFKSAAIKAFNMRNRIRSLHKLPPEKEEVIIIMDSDTGVQKKFGCSQKIFTNGVDSDIDKAKKKSIAIEIP